jgi:hypothetical protein
VPTKPGERLKFEDLGVEVIVTKGGEGDVTAGPADDDGLKVGKRYQDEASGIEVMVTKPGSASLLCNGATMALLEPKKTKSAD